MPSFTWRGRDARGDDLSGEIEAATKDEAIRLLLARQIRVIAIEGATGIGAPARRRDASGLAVRLTIAAAVLVGAVLMVGITTVTRIRCTRTASERVGCTVISGPLGAWPLPSDTLLNVTGVAVEERRSADQRSLSDRNTTAVNTTIRRLILSGDNRTVSTQWISYPLGESARGIESRINAYLTTPSDAGLDAWQASMFVVLALVLVSVGLFIGVSGIRRTLTPARAGRTGVAQQ